ncbi:MAG: response regulator, partial [Clostridia bacterium]|nr:response regulator [Clostridia bacterium]
MLVVDDEMINREMLGMILSDQYEVLYAENGVKALEVIRENAEDLSLILLDVMMPEMDGFELLQILQNDEHLRHIPVIILTTEQSYEVRCLHLGASDFIKKPYELPEVILARIARTIALSENTYIIQTTEHDPLTGLYNQAFFFQYAEQFDRHHPGRFMDAAVVDIMHFHLLNELYGRETGNDLLKKLAVEALAFAREANGLVCRKEADTFFLYCPHLDSFEPLVERLEKALYDPKIRMPVQVRIGVYSEADQTISVPSRFDRAKLALDTVRASFVSKISFYDSEMHRQALLSQQLINEMENALEQKQFQVYYQPKYSILGEKPVLSSAEALIRWRHPELGMISPGVFIPLFENNGLISKLDHFVWKEAAAQIRRWRDQFG